MTSHTCSNKYHVKSHPRILAAWHIHLTVSTTNSHTPKYHCNSKLKHQTNINFLHISLLLVVEDLLYKNLVQSPRIDCGAADRVSAMAKVHENENMPFSTAQT